MTILFEDDSILVCRKPAGIATTAAKVTEKDVLSEVNNHIKRAGGNPAHLIHRLDKPVEGILLFAKDKTAAGFLSDALQNGKMEKRYYALVEGKIAEKTGELTNYIYKDSKIKKAVIADGEKAGAGDGKAGDAKIDDAKKGEAKIAKLKYSVVEKDDVFDGFGGFGDFGDRGGLAATGLHNIKYTLLDIELITGRFHQIRAQLSHIGHPIVGDTLYGGAASGTGNNICLVAYKLIFPHPKTRKIMEFSI